MLDANMVVSLQSKPLEYLDDSSLEGQRIGSVQGFSYVDIEGMIPPSQRRAPKVVMLTTSSLWRAGSVGFI